jgi:hypothetical protein
MGRSHQHSRRTDAALGSAGLDKCPLQTMKSAIAPKMLNSADAGTIRLEHRHQTTVDQLIVQQNSAGTAFAFTTTFLSSCQL